MASFLERLADPVVEKLVGTWDWLRDITLGRRGTPDRQDLRRLSLSSLGKPSGEDLKEKVLKKKSNSSSLRLKRNGSSVSLSSSADDSSSASMRKRPSIRKLARKKSLLQPQGTPVEDAHLYAVKLFFSPPKKKKVLVLDLDETLVHSTSKGSRHHDHLIEVLVDQHICLYYVYKRPYLDYFLEKVSEWYQIVIFTASMPAYADPVIDFLDSRLCVISKRFFRDVSFSYPCALLNCYTPDS